MRELSSTQRDLIMPKVVVSSAGVFHAYHLARGAQSGGYLHRFITSLYSRYETGLDRSRVVQIRLPAYLSRMMSALPGEHARALSYYFGDNLYDWLARRYAGDGDIFHFFNHQGLYSLRVAKRRGAITIVERSSAHPTYQHELLAEEYTRYGLRYPSVYRLLHDKHLVEYGEADYIMVASEFVRRTMVEAGVPSEKLVRVHLGFDPARFRPGEKRDDVFRVMYAGRITLQKGVQYLLQAFSQLDIPRSELVLTGEIEPDAQAFVPKYEGLFRHLRFVPQAELVHQYQQASVFVLPSLQDGFGMVVYEAAACGLPIIVTENVGATIRDGQDGFVVPIRDAEALARKLTYLYEHPQERIAMGREARDFVQQFTWENYHRELVSHYGTIWNAR